MQSAVCTREYAVSGPDLSGIAHIWTHETHMLTGKTVGRTEYEDSDARQGQLGQRSPRTRFDSAEFEAFSTIHTLLSISHLTH